MTYVIVYLIFCVTTSISAVLEVFWPILKSAKAEGIDNEFTNSPYLSVFVFFVINIFFAPLMFLGLFMPGCYARTYAGISKVVHQE